MEEVKFYTFIVYLKISEGSAVLHEQFVDLLMAFKCPLGIHSCIHELMIIHIRFCFLKPT